MDWRFSGILFLFVLGWLFVAPIISFLVARRNNGLAPITFTVADEGLHLAHKAGQSTVYWAGMKRVQQAKRGLLFVVPARSFGIPRRAFANDAAFVSFSEAAIACWKRHHGQ